MSDQLFSFEGRFITLKQINDIKVSRIIKEEVPEEPKKVEEKKPSKKVKEKSEDEVLAEMIAEEEKQKLDKILE